MKRSYVLFLVLAFFGCGRRQAEQDVPARPPLALDSPVEFSVSQRSTTPLPKSDGKLLLTLDEITTGEAFHNLSPF